jgi:uncharacterized membrane protein
MALFFLAHARTCAARLLDSRAHIAPTQPTAIVGPVPTVLGRSHGCNPSTVCPSDRSTPHPCVAAASHLIHTRPPDVHVATLAYQRSLSNTYFSLDLRRHRRIRSRYRAPALTFLVSDAATVTCLTARTTDRLLAMPLAAVHAAVLTARMTAIAPGVNLIFRQMMPPLNAAVLSHMKTFLATSTAYSWSSESSFVRF